MAAAYAPHAPRLAPHRLWSAACNGPVVGLALAPEGQRVLAWDQRGQVYSWSFRAQDPLTAAPTHPVIAADTSWDARTTAVLCQDGSLARLTERFDGVEWVVNVPNPLSVAVSPHGDYVAVSSGDGRVWIYDRHGRRLCEAQRHRPVKYLRFLASRPCWLGSAEYGLIGCYELDGAPIWQSQVWSNVGGLSASGDGRVVYLPTFGGGLQRYSFEGTNEGAYHIGMSVARASCDYAGENIAFLDDAGRAGLLDYGGQVRWVERDSPGWSALALDPLARLLLLGAGSGEVALIALWEDAQLDRCLAGGGGGPGAPAARWNRLVFESESEAQSALVAWIPGTEQFIVAAASRRIQVFDGAGQRISQGEALHGIGHVLKASRDRVAVATDRAIGVYDARRATHLRLSGSLAAISHLELEEGSGCAALLEERDILSWLNEAGERAWKRSLKRTVSYLAVAKGRLALSLDEGAIQVWSSDGEEIGRWDEPSGEPPLVAALGRGWVSLTLQHQRLRGHAADGSLLWETRIEEEPWRMRVVANRLFIIASDGLVREYDASGVACGPGTRFPRDLAIGEDSGGDVVVIAADGPTLFCNRPDGTPVWRFPFKGDLGAVAISPSGVLAVVDRQLFCLR